MLTVLGFIVQYSVVVDVRDWRQGLLSGEYSPPRGRADFSVGTVVAYQVSSFLLDGVLTLCLGTAVAYEVSRFLLGCGLNFSVGTDVADQVSRFFDYEGRSSFPAKVSVYLVARRPITDFIFREGRG